MIEFKIGDRVRIKAGYRTNAMQCVGECAEVVEVKRESCNVRLDGKPKGWRLNFLHRELEIVSDD